VAVAALATADGARLAGEDAVSKSYPGFFSDLDALRRKA
jgi:5-enolpyruvylshikimate-3-phosphate synthase